MAAKRPIADDAALLAASDETWRTLTPADWMEAFQSHPRIGESRSSSAQPPQALPSRDQSVEWSTQEQGNIAYAETAVKIALADANREYEQRFNRVFIVCATGKSGPEILEILRRRLNNDADAELHQAAEQQSQITQIRLKKWLQE